MLCGGAKIEPFILQLCERRTFLVVFVYKNGRHLNVYDASRSKISRSAHGEKCPKTNLESQGVLCKAYTLIVVYIVYCEQMAHI